MAEAAPELNLRGVGASCDTGADVVHGVIGQITGWTIRGEDIASRGAWGAVEQHLGKQ